MFDHLQDLRGPVRAGFDTSAPLEQRVLDLLGGTSGSAQGQRVRQLVRERFTTLRADAAPAPAGEVSEPARQGYAEPGTTTDRINQLQGLCERIEARLRAAEEAIGCLAEEASRLRRDREDLEARLASAEATIVAVQGRGDST
jgi:hypothetical protein